MGQLALIAAFNDVGLEAEVARGMTKADYGIGPMKAEEGKRILIPSLCEIAAARINMFFLYD